MVPAGGLLPPENSVTICGLQYMNVWWLQSIRCLLLFSHLSQIDYTSLPYFQPWSHFSDVWAWDCEWPFHCLFLNVLFFTVIAGSPFMGLCVCFCLHSCFTPDFDCNDVEGKLQNILHTRKFPQQNLSVLTPTPTMKAISSWPCLNPLEKCVHSHNKSLITARRACKFKQVPWAFGCWCAYIWCVFPPFRECFLPAYTIDFLPAPTSYHLSTDTQFYLDWPCTPRPASSHASPWIRPTLT